MEYGTGAIMAFLRTINATFEFCRKSVYPFVLSFNLRTPTARPGKNDCGLRRTREWQTSATPAL